MRDLKHTYIYALMLFAVAGCSESSVGVVGEDAIEDDVVDKNEVETDDDGAISFSSSDDSWTRGSVVSDKDLTEFGVYSYYLPSDGSVDYKSTTPQYMYNQEVSFASSGDNNGKWEYSPIKYWPEYDTDALLFWAYAPYSDDHSDVYVDVTNTDEAVIVYNSPSTMAESKDFIVAATYCTGDDWEETVTMDFYHQLTRVNFAFRTDVISSESGTESQDDEVQTLYSMLVKSIKLINVRTKSSFATTKDALTGEMTISYCEDGEKSTGTITATEGDGGGLDKVYVSYNSDDPAKYTDITTDGEYLFIDTNVVSDDVQIWLEAEIEIYIYDDYFDEKTLTLSVTNTVMTNVTDVFDKMENTKSYTLQLSHKPVAGSALWVYSLEYWEDIYNQNDM